MARKVNSYINGKKYFRKRVKVGEDETGKAIFKNFYGESETDTLNKIEEFKNFGVITKNKKRRTFQQLYLYWLNEVIKPSGIKPNSFERYMVIYNNYVKKAPFAFSPVTEIETFHIQTYYNQLANEKSFSVIESIHKQFKRFFKYLYASRQIPFNPIEAVVIPYSVKEKNKAKEKIKKTYSKDERDTLLVEAFHTHAIYGCIMYLMFKTGIRPGEALGLRKNLIDFKNKKIFIKSTSAKVREFDYDGNVVGSVFQNDTTKTSESTREVYFNNQIEMIIRNAMALQERQKEKNPLYDNADDLLFTTASGKPIESRNLRRFWERLCIRLKLPYRSPHKTRHTFISEMDSLGVDRSILQQIVGHKVDSIITEKHYIEKDQKLIEEIMLKAIESI